APHRRADAGPALHARQDPSEDPARAAGRLPAPDGPVTPAVRVYGPNRRPRAAAGPGRRPLRAITERAAHDH
ncbi:hypothetical protein ACFV2T_36875, partial [Streptomyces sp. NPDC059651]